eukprot:474216-Pyramimonas_sp.AAC.3
MQIVWEQQSTVSAEPYCQPRAVVEGPGARLLGVRGELALKAVVRGKEGLRLQQCGHTAARPRPPSSRSAARQVSARWAWMAQARTARPCASACAR